MMEIPLRRLIAMKEIHDEVARWLMGLMKSQLDMVK